MKCLGINAGESLRRSWKALRLHLPNTGKMNERAIIAGNVALATDLLLINTKLPPNPAYINLSPHAPQRPPAQTLGKQKDRQDLASIPRAALAQPGIFHGSLHRARARSFLRHCLRCLLLNSCLESASGTYGSVLTAVQQRVPTGVLIRAGVLELFSSNKIQ